MAHVDAQIVAAVGMRGAPDFAQQFAVRHHGAASAEQHRQQPVFDRREMHGLAIAADQATR